MAKMLSSDEVRTAEDLKREVVEVPEWGGAVIVRALTAQELDEFKSSNLIRTGDKYEANLVNGRARLVVRALVNEDGSRMFTDADAEELGKKSSTAIHRLYAAAARLTPLNEEAEEAIAKNSPAAQGDSSSLD